MATLKLMIPADDRRYTLMETGEQYEQLWRFRDVAEARSHLARLEIDPQKLAELWAGQEIELTEGLAWPTKVSVDPAQSAAHPAALDQPRSEQRPGGRR